MKVCNDSARIVTYGLPEKQDEKKAAGDRIPASARLATFSKRAARPPKQTLIILAVCRCKRLADSPVFLPAAKKHCCSRPCCALRKPTPHSRRLRAISSRLLFWLFQAMENTSGCKNNQEQAATVSLSPVPTVAACSVRFLKTGNLPVIIQAE